MLGNSSAGIIEAASFNTPVVNIGNRQQGPERSKNVIDVDVHVDQIKSAVTDLMRYGCANIVNVYGDGDSREKNGFYFILKEWELCQNWSTSKFFETCK